MIGLPSVRTVYAPALLEIKFIIVYVHVEDMMVNSTLLEQLEGMWILNTVVAGNPPKG